MQADSTCNMARNEKRNALTRVSRNKVVVEVGLACKPALNEVKHIITTLRARTTTVLQNTSGTNKSRIIVATTVAVVLRAILISFRSSSGCAIGKACTAPDCCDAETETENDNQNVVHGIRRKSEV